MQLSDELVLLVAAALAGLSADEARIRLDVWRRRRGLKRTRRTANGVE